jgi:hypothetical protein
VLEGTADLLGELTTANLQQLPVDNRLRDGGKVV